MPERLRIQKAEKNNPKLIVIKSKHHQPPPQTDGTWIPGFALLILGQGNWRQVEAWLALGQKQEPGSLLENGLSLVNKHLQNRVSKDRVSAVAGNTSP